MGLQEETIGGRPVWVLPNPSGLNAHYKPADFARVYAEAAAYARTRNEHMNRPSSRPSPQSRSPSASARRSRPTS